MIAVCVTFDVKNERWQAFLPLMHAQAANSLSREEGCHQFDVCTGSDVDNRAFLYELYTDRAAFDAHRATEHFKAFDAAVADMIATKEVAIFDTVTPGA